MSLPSSANGAGDWAHSRTVAADWLVMIQVGTMMGSKPSSATLYPRRREARLMRRLGPLAAGDEGLPKPAAGGAAGRAAGASGAGCPVGTAFVPNKLSKGEAGVAAGGGWTGAEAAGGEKAANGEAGVSAGPRPGPETPKGEAGAGLAGANIPGVGGAAGEESWAAKGEDCGGSPTGWAGAFAAAKGLAGKIWAGAPPGKDRDAGASRGMSARGGGGPLRLGGSVIMGWPGAEKGLASGCA